MALSDILKQGLSHPTAMAATATAAPMATLCNENGRFILFRPKTSLPCRENESEHSYNEITSFASCKLSS